MTTTTEKKILKELRKYEGQTVGDFLYSDLAEMIGIDTFKVNGVPLGCGEDYDPKHEGKTIRTIYVYNVMGHMFADITTE